MKIFLPFKVKDIGGTSTFARKFQSGMEAAGHTVVFEPCDDYDVLFLIVQCPLKYVVDAKRRGKKIVQRLDGTYYWTVSGWKFPLMNAKAMYIRHLFTDVTIYQSEYSRECANRFLGKKRHDVHAVIYNGVDLNLFKPEGKRLLTRQKPDQKIFFTASAFRRKDQIEPLLEALKQYAKKYNRNFKFYIAGNFVGEVKDVPLRLKKLKYVHLLGKVSNADLPSYERSADVFLFTHLNPPCPNNIIESLACGLPVCGIQDGAMAEIVPAGKAGELLHLPGTGFWRHREFNAQAFASNIHKILANQKVYATTSKEIAQERFSLSLMIEQYIKVMSQ